MRGGGETATTSADLGNRVVRSLCREIPSQCGCCSSCLLRRQGLLALGLEDQTQYGVLSEIREAENANLPAAGRHRNPFKATYLQAMKYQVDNLKSDAPKR